jgi:hypothetical protein
MYRSVSVSACSSPKVLCCGTAPGAISFSRVSATASTVLTCAVSRSTIAAGVPAGASSAIHEPGSPPLTPAPASVGTSGKATERFA